MTISTAALTQEGADRNRVVIVPKEHLLGSSAWTYRTWASADPVSSESASFLIASNDTPGTPPQLYAMDSVNWKNHTLKNPVSTPDGKPYRALFITRDAVQASQLDVAATVVGTHPCIYLLRRVSPVYFLLPYFKTLLEKVQLDDGSKQRLLSYDDLLDAILASDASLNCLHTEFHFDLRKYIELSCDTVVVPSLESDSENDDSHFYKPSLEKIIGFLNSKLVNLIDLLQHERKVSSLKTRMASMFPADIPHNIQLLLWKRQAISLLSIHVDQWYLNHLVQSLHPSYDFTLLDEYILTTKSQQQAQDAFQESLDKIQEGTVGASKKQKLTTSKPSRKSKPAVKVKSGALDMFFKKKE